MEQIDPHYLAALLDKINGSERKITEFAYGSLRIVFEGAEQTEPQISGFTAGGQPKAKESDDTPGAMHRRLMGRKGLPEFTVPIPTKQDE